MRQLGQQLLWGTVPFLHDHFSTSKLLDLADRCKHPNNLRVTPTTWSPKLLRDVQSQFSLQNHEETSGYKICGIKNKPVQRSVTPLLHTTWQAAESTLIKYQTNTVNANLSWGASSGTFGKAARCSKESNIFVTSSVAHYVWGSPKTSRSLWATPKFCPSVC